MENIRVVKQPDILQRAPKALDKKETHRILRETDRRGNLRDYAIVVLLLNTGLRVGELVRLDRNDVDISERKGELIVRWAKGGKVATLPCGFHNDSNSVTECWCYRYNLGYLVYERYSLNVRNPRGLS